MTIGDEKTKYLHLSVPFSIRETPTKREHMELRNDFAVLKVKLDLSEDFNYLLKETHKRMHKLKTSIEPFAMYYFIQLSLCLPQIISSYVNKYVCDSMSIVFSNVPGPREPYIIDGAKSKKIVFLVPGLENIATGISMITHENVLKIAINSDLSQI